jgi:hypothetical protein
MVNGFHVYDVHVSLPFARIPVQWKAMEKRGGSKSAPCFPFSLL